MTLDTKGIIKHFALLDELETSNKLIELGLGEIQNIDIRNNFRFLPFQLLSQGFERFMKSYICLAYENLNKKYPTYKYLKSLGHDLESLLNEILKYYYFDYCREQYLKDVEFLRDNKDLKELLHILSEFGKKSRYYNFDLITESADIPLNTNELWSNFENKYLLNDSVLLEKLFNPETESEVYEKINSIIIIVFEKFISGLSRQFIYNCLGEKAKQISATSFFDFGLLYEKDYGLRDYRKKTTRYKQAERKVHKRTAADEFERTQNPNYKSKKIRKSEYIGDWPFYAEEVIIECREKNWCVITIGEHDYALNGSAKGRYKLENPHDAGMAIIGKSTADFIKLAFEL